MQQQTLRYIVACAAAVLVMPVLTAGSAAMADPVTDIPTVITVTSQDGSVTATARALTATEIKAKGLDRYIDMTKQKETAPRLVGGVAATSGKTPSAPRNWESTNVAIQSAGCWSVVFKYGVFGYPELYGATSVNWCGNGAYVTYANSGCWGSANWPSYNYMSCSNYPNYGTGWDQYWVESHWDLCTGWFAYWGACLTHAYPWEFYKFAGSGAWWWVAGTQGLIF